MKLHIRNTTTRKYLAKEGSGKIWTEYRSEIEDFTLKEARRKMRELTDSCNPDPEQGYDLRVTCKIY